MIVSMVVEEQNSLSSNRTQSFNDANTKAHEPDLVPQILTTYTFKIQLNIILPSPQFSKWLFSNNFPIKTTYAFLLSYMYSPS